MRRSFFSLQKPFLSVAKNLRKLKFDETRGLSRQIWVSKVITAAHKGVTFNIFPGAFKKES